MTSDLTSALEVSHIMRSTNRQMNKLLFLTLLCVWTVEFAYSSLYCITQVMSSDK